MNIDKYVTVKNVAMLNKISNKKPFLKKEYLGQLRFEKWCSEFNLLQPK